MRGRLKICCNAIPIDHNLLYNRNVNVLGRPVSTARKYGIYRERTYLKKENQDASLAKIVLVANMYYRNGFSQQQISETLQISRPWVSKLLTRATELGIVEIRVNSSIGENRELSDQLRSRFGLRYASAVAMRDEHTDSPAISAVNYFLSRLKPDMVVGVGWGKSISRMIANMPEIRIPGIRVVPMGGSFGTSIETMANYSAIQIAEKTGGTAIPLHAPALCASNEEYEAITSNMAFSDIEQLMGQAELALVGIGALEATRQTGIFTAEQLSDLESADALGDIVLNFVNSAGERVETDMTRRIIAADMEKIARSDKEIIAFAEGIEKVRVIRAALEGKLISSLITSEETAVALLQ